MAGPPRTLHVVTGKGGVGKSTVAAALALAAAARGRRVLAIELGAAGGLARVLGAAPPAPGAIVPVTAGLSLAYIEGAAALAEYLTRKVRLGRLGRRVMVHPLYRAFVGAAPGLRELLAMGKVRDELVLQRDGDRPRWDLVVLDAGASGHALEHLRMPAAAARAFGAGLVHREAERNAALLRDPAVCAVQVVATPEELPLREALQIIGALRDHGLPLGAVLVNQCRPDAPAGAEAALARLGAGDAEARALAAVAGRALGWTRLQERWLAVLAREAGVLPVRLPRVWSAAAGDVARALARSCAEVLA